MNIFADVNTDLERPGGDLVGSISTSQEESDNNQLGANEHKTIDAQAVSALHQRHADLVTVVVARYFSTPPHEAAKPVD